jgi:hypothetical protein
VATPRLPDHDLTSEEKDAFLGYVREHQDCSVREACNAVGLQRKDVRRLRKESSEFDDDYREARGYGNEQMVNTFRKLAIEGVEEPLVSAGKLVRDDDGNIVTKRVWSDRLLSRGLELYTPEGKAALANKLGIEISGPDGGPIEIQRGVSFDDVAKVLRAAGKLPELEAPEGTAEVVDEQDEPV